jgi:hypothetical protein
MDEPISNTANANIRVSISDGATSGDQKTETPVLVDNVSPEISDMNLVNGQSVTENPYIITAKATDSAAGIWKLEFYVDGNLLCTDTAADANGNYSCSWDTSLYQSDIEVIAYDLVGNTDTDDLETYVYLAGTGDDLQNLRNIELALASLFPIMILIKFRKKFL